MAAHVVRPSGVSTRKEQFLDFEAFQVTQTFITDFLATTPASAEMFEAWRRVKLKRANAPTQRHFTDANTQDEIDAHAARLAELETEIDQDALSRLMVFPRDARGVPCVWNYQVRGALKERAADIAHELGPQRGEGEGPAGLKQAASKIEKILYVGPRLIPLIPPRAADAPTLSVTDTDGIAIDRLERPLRGMTQQGPRVTLVASERVHPGWQLQYLLFYWTDNPFKFSRRNVDAVAEATGLGFGGWRTGEFGMSEVSVKSVATHVPLARVIEYSGGVAGNMLLTLSENVA